MISYEIFYYIIIRRIIKHFARENWKDRYRRRGFVIRVFVDFIVIVVVFQGVLFYNKACQQIVLLWGVL